MYYVNTSLPGSVFVYQVTCHCLARKIYINHNTHMFDQREEWDKYVQDYVDAFQDLLVMSKELINNIFLR